VTAFSNVKPAAQGSRKTKNQGHMTSPKGHNNLVTKLNPMEIELPDQE
jgi:hypothetical protein